MHVKSNIRLCFLLKMLSPSRAWRATFLLVLVALLTGGGRGGSVASALQVVDDPQQEPDDAMDGELVLVGPSPSGHVDSVLRDQLTIHPTHRGAIERIFMWKRTHHVASGIVFSLLELYTTRFVSQYLGVG